MKILFVTNHLNGTDGWSRYSLDIVNEVAKNNEVLCLVNKISKNKRDYEKEIFDNPLNYLANPLKTVVTAKKINKIINDFSPDVIHFIVEPYITILPFLKIKNKTKVILTAHGTYSYFPNVIKNKFKKIISLFLYKKAILKIDKIISVSNFTKDYLLQNINNDKFKKAIKEKINIITNGIDLDKIKLDIDNKKSDEMIKRILFVGAVKKRKGLLESIMALKYYKENFSNNFIYNIIGNYNDKDDYYKELIDKIKKYRLEDNIFFKGIIQDDKKEKYYQKSDLFLMLPASDGKYFEGFGLVYLEASFRGVPCVVSDSGGSKEAILDGTTGYVVNSFDSESIAEKINLILNKKKIKKENCINWAMENDIKEKVDEIIKIYKN